MNEKNVAYLKENLKYLGFGDSLFPELQKNIEQGFPQFVLKQHTEFGKKALEAHLYFKRPEKGELYFFNSYDAKLKSEVGKVEQTFFVNKGSGITLKEAFNLLEGRAVHKELSNSEGQKYTAWLQLNFGVKDTNNNFKIKQYHQNYGYDLEKALAQYSIKELGNEQQKERLIHSLQKGNLQSVTIEKEGRSQIYFMEAAPQYKNLNVYDGSGKKLLMEKGEGFILSASGSKEWRQGAKEQQKEDGKERRQAIKASLEKKGIAPVPDSGLLPKKRVRNPKGLSLG